MRLEASKSASSGGWKTFNSEVEKCPSQGIMEGGSVGENLNLSRRASAPRWAGGQ